MQLLSVPKAAPPPKLVCPVVQFSVSTQLLSVLESEPPPEEKAELLFSVQLLSVPPAAPPPPCVA